MFVLRVRDHDERRRLPLHQRLEFLRQDRAGDAAGHRSQRRSGSALRHDVQQAQPAHGVLQGAGRLGRGRGTLLGLDLLLALQRKAIDLFLRGTRIGLGADARVPLDVGRRDGGGDQHAEDHRDRELQRQRHVDRIPAAPALGHVGHALEGRRRRHRDRLGRLGARPVLGSLGLGGRGVGGLVAHRRESMPAQAAANAGLQLQSQQAASGRGRSGGGGVGEGVAERAGFEPAVPFDTHDFQSCTFGHSVTSPGIGQVMVPACKKRPLGRASLYVGHACCTPLCGERGIRTPGTLAGTPDFESGAIDRTLPSLQREPRDPRAAPGRTG